MGRVKEIWKTVPGFPLYEVFSDGTVLSFHRSNPRFLRQHLNLWGYLTTTLVNSDGLFKRVMVHNVVMWAFCGPTPNGKEVNHKDGDKSNNHISNLEYVTKSENIKHAYANGLMKKEKGEKCFSSKLKDKDVLAIIKDKRGAKDIALSYGVSPGCINFIKSGRTWSHLTKGMAITKKKQNDPKLLPSQVLDIKRTIGPHKIMAEKYNITQSNVCSIRKGKTWAWLK